MCATTFYPYCYYMYASYIVSCHTYTYTPMIRYYGDHIILAVTSVTFSDTLCQVY